MGHELWAFDLWVAGAAFDFFCAMRYVLSVLGDFDPFWFPGTMSNG